MSTFCRTLGSGFCLRAEGAFLRQPGSSSHLALSWLGRSRFSTSGDLSSLLVRVAAGDLSPASAAAKLAPLLVSGGAQAEDVGGFAKIDHDRSRRVGFPEVVFGEGKSAEQIVDILKAMITEGRERSEAITPVATAAPALVATAAAGGVAGAPVSAEAEGVREVDMSTRSRIVSPIVATRVSPEKWAAISAGLSGLRYHADARIVSFGAPRSLAEGAAAAAAAGPIGATAAAATHGVPSAPTSGTAGKVKPSSSSSSSAMNVNFNVNIDVVSIGKVAVLSAGTSDLAVAEEAAVLAELAGAEVSRFHDVGVAGIHRLLGVIPEVGQAGIAICVAGMDGAMPGVVAGLVKCPVVAVPTSVGYGAAMSGLAPLLTMLNACAPGVSVVNIDNGFGAAAFAIKLLKSSHASRKSDS